jgi:hypothetical protein
MKIRIDTHATDARIRTNPTKLTASDLQITTTLLDVQLENVELDSVARNLRAQIPPEQLQEALRKAGYRCRVTSVKP